MTKKQVWDRAAIKAELERKGYTLSGLAVQYGYHPNSMSQCFTKSWPAGERIIAKALKVHPSELWPERYDADGNKKSCTAIRNHYARNLLNGNVQSARGV